MAGKSQHRKSTEVRRANSYVPVAIANVDKSCYPSTVPSSIGALHDADYCQGMLSNPGNYTQQSELDIIELNGGHLIQRDLKGEADCQSYLDVSAVNKKPILTFLSILIILQTIRSPPHVQAIRFRVV